MNLISETDLILNPDGSVYHLQLLPDDIANTIITVGDQDRVAAISKYFDRIEIKKANREFVTHTGFIGNKKLTVISTGIGTDNIDIVLNELDALVNIDLTKRTIIPDLKRLDIIRIGTTGAVQADVEIDSLLVSSSAIGLDALMHYYKYRPTAAGQELLDEFILLLPKELAISPYFAEADARLVQSIGYGLPQGVSITAPGFYAAQGRQVRAQAATDNLLDIIQNFSSGKSRITNLEMETAGIYGLAAALGHRAISFNVVMANRITQQFSKHPEETMDRCIRQVLERLIKLP